MVDEEYNTESTSKILAELKNWEDVSGFLYEKKLKMLTG